MPRLYYTSVTIHVLAAILWLGGMLFLGIVAAPVLRATEPAALRQKLFHQMGTRFRTVGWWSIGVLVITGLINLHYRGWLHWKGVLASADFWRTPAGYALAVKLVVVALMVTISALHDFIHGPRASRVPPDSPEAAVLRRRASYYARINAFLAVLLVIAAVRLARGG